MASLLSIPENVMIQQLFPYLDHNDLLRLRRVSKQIKALADAYLWTPQPGHQGKWELKIDYRNEDQTLQAFLQKGLPPPSRLHIVNREETAPAERMSFFEDEQLEEFMEHYGKYVTHLRLDKLFFPFTSEKVLGFYESLVNLEELDCVEMVTVGGAAKFEQKTKNAGRSFLIRPTFKRLTVFKVFQTDCIDSMWNFVNGVSSNLKELMHPFERKNGTGAVLGLAPVRELIERRGMTSQSKLLYDWNNLSDTDPLELLGVFASCRDNGVMIKNLSANFLDCLLCKENGRIANRDEVVDRIAREWIHNSAVNYERNLFVGNVIHSLEGLTDNLFLMEMPALDNIIIWRNDNLEIFRRRGVGYPQWPSLRKMYVELAYSSRAYIPFLFGEVERPKLEELSLTYDCWSVCVPTGRLPFPRNLGNCCGNVKKLTIRYPWSDNVFLRFWKELGLLEDVTLYDCKKLTDKGFIGNEADGNEADWSGPAFLKLEKLKHLTLRKLEKMPGITNTVFKEVCRHLRLSSFTLSSDNAIDSISVVGVKELLTGSFAETIVKLDLDLLELEGVSEEELKKVVSGFRSSEML